MSHDRAARAVISVRAGAAGYNADGAKRTQLSPHDSARRRSAEHGTPHTHRQPLDQQDRVFDRYARRCSRSRSPQQAHRKGDRRQ